MDALRVNGLRMDALLRTMSVRRKAWHGFVDEREMAQM